MELAEIILEYLKVFLSTPVILGIVALVFFLLFKQNIKALIDRINKLTLPGGSEISTPQLERASEEITVKGAPPEPEDVSLPQGLNLTQEQLQNVVSILENERTRGALWEYRYLNYFFVRHTQEVLDWLGTVNDTTPSLFDSLWMATISSAGERNAVVGALQTHRLIEIDGDLIKITPKGRQYLKWRGALPPIEPRPG